MQNNQKLLITFRLNPQRAKSDGLPIYIKIYLDGKRVEIATKYFVQSRYWDSRNFEVKSSHPNYLHINNMLTGIKNTVSRHFLELSISGNLVDVFELKNKFLNIAPKAASKTICQAFELHNIKAAQLVQVGKLSPKTSIKFIVLLNKIKAFLKQNYGKNDFNLSEMKLSFANEFEHYLLTIDKLQSNTAHKYIKQLKKVINMAVTLDWIQVNPISRFKCSFYWPEREILTQEEINLLFTKEISVPRLAEVRDVFVFCCYTGFAYIDVFNFEYDAVTIGLDGHFWLKTNRQKTGTKESVPILPIPLQIIERYRNNKYCLAHNKLLPINTNEKYNAYLKEIAIICNIKKNLTTHIARHTFATTITLSNGVPIETVSSMLGHKNIKTTQIYAKVVEKKVSEDMKALREKLNPKEPVLAVVSN